MVFVDFLGASEWHRRPRVPTALSPAPQASGTTIWLYPEHTDASPGLSYTAEYQPSGASMRIKVCNPTHANIDDGNTHFNLLVIDAQ